MDSQGWPHAPHVPTANVSDQAGVVDGGYRGRPFARAVQEVCGAGVEVVKRSDVPRFTVIPKRWVVEPSVAWLEKCRRLWMNCERHLSTSLQMVVLVFILLLLKRF